MAEVPPVPPPVPEPEHQTLVLTDPPPEKHHALLWSLCVLAVALMTGGIVYAYWQVNAHSTETPAVFAEKEKSVTTTSQISNTTSIDPISYARAQAAAQKQGLSLVFSPDGAWAEFAKDKDYIYVLDLKFVVFGGMQKPEGFDDVNRYFFSGVDAPTFESIDQHFFKDKNNVYYSSWQDFVVVDGADVQTFSRIPGSGQYSRDKNRVYSYWHVIEDADPLTFEAIGDSWFAKDKTSVFIDFSSFEYPSTASLVEGASPLTFEPLFSNDGDFSEPTLYGKDTQYIYCMNKRLAAADINTFVPEGSLNAKDKNYTYTSCSIYDPDNP